MRRWAAQAGQVAAEYIGGLLLVSVLVAGLATTQAGVVLRGDLADVVCRIAGAGCGSAVAPADLDVAAADLQGQLARSAAPADVAAFFARLDPATARALARERPELVGNLDGAPLELRFAANALRVQRSGIARLRGEGRRFLLFDPSGDGRVAEVFGPLETARHVAIVVPGMDNELSNYSPANAHHLYDQAQALAGADGVATIQWLGYDTPEGLTAATQGPANAGARALTPFLEGIRVQRTGAPLHVTVVGHSYGSLVLGRALRDTGLAVDDAVAVGSPGMGVHHAGDLGGGFARLWAARAAWDPVGSAPVHGPDPHSPGFGARRFSTGDIRGHSSYFQPGSLSLYNLGLIVAGRPVEVH